MTHESAADNSVPSLHRRQAQLVLRCGVVTVSDTRTAKTDRGGPLVCDYLTTAGHEIVVREIIPDEPLALRVCLQHWQQDLALDVILLTGGTGITARDQTWETLQGLLTKMIPGYGELFRWLSFQEIGPAAMLSRAVGGLLGSTVLLTMPGSPAAVRLAMERLIVPELGHLVQQARS